MKLQLFRFREEKYDGSHRRFYQFLVINRVVVFEFILWHDFPSPLDGLTILATFLRSFLCGIDFTVKGYSVSFYLFTDSKDFRP
jgi:hypothetical protein